MGKLKNELREEIKNKIKMLDDDYKKNSQLALLKSILPLIKKSQKIAIYNALPIEISLISVIEYCKSHNKDLYQPLAYKDNRLMTFVPYSGIALDIFVSSQYISQSKEAWYNLDLIIIPLIGADKFGNRLGKGGGYYDMTLASRNKHKSYTILCGVGFDMQYVDLVPTGNSDIRLDYFASELRLVEF